MIDDTETPSISVDGEQQPQEQARGKGRMPEAGPWHGTAGLRVEPERAAAACGGEADQYGGREG